MKGKFRFPKMAVVLAVVLTLISSGIVYAITISVDGEKEAVWDGDGISQTPGVAGDGDEVLVSNPYDIKEVRWTNDVNNMYWLIETYQPFDGDVDFATTPVIHICIDIDNNPGTGRNIEGYCNNMSGVDRRVSIFPVDQIVEVRRPTGTNSWTLVSGSFRAAAWADADSNLVADYPYIEVGVDLASLTITGASTCLAAMPSAVYYDNGIEDPEDATPNSSTIDMGCGSPTAVTLSSLATTPASVAPAAMIVVGLVGTFGAVVVLRRRR